MHDNRKSSEHATRQLRKLRNRVAALMSGSAPKRLTDRQRLAAAAHVGRLVKDARDGGCSMTELCESLGRVMPSKSESSLGEPFRLHRWMLKGGAIEVTEALAAQYRGRPEPLRSTKTYLRLIEQLGLIAKRDPLECQGGLLTALDLLEGRLQSSENDLLPEQRLSDLLHAHVARIAQKFDLVRLFQQAERVQGGWNIQRGPDAVVDLVPENSAFFSASEPFNRRCWLEIASPPVPSAAIARLPFGRLPGPFRLTNDAGESHERPGHAVAYWELHLAIAPSGPLSVSAYLLRGTSVDLVLDGEAIKLPDQRDDVEQILTGDPQPPRIELDDVTWTISSVSCETLPFYRSQRRGLDEYPPSETVPFLRIDPVSASSVRAWLMTSLSLMAKDGAWGIGAEDLCEGGPPRATGWIRIASIARSVEASLRDGLLEARFKDWLDRFRPNLDRFEQDWIDRTITQDEALRQRSAHSDLTGDDA